MCVCVSVFAPAAEESACLRQVQGEALEFASADLKPFERTMQNTWLLCSVVEQNMPSKPFELLHVARTS